MLQTILKSIILVLSGMTLLRIAGRKSISQMTIIQTVVMISIGSIIIQPIIEKSIIRTIVASATFVFTLMLIEYIVLKFNVTEKFIIGKEKIVIQDGKFVTENLRKLRTTTNEIKMRLRLQGISNVSDVKTATLERNGQLGYELMKDAKPVTVGDLKEMLSHIIATQNQQPAQNTNIFDAAKNTLKESRQPKNIH